jgi:hypothetical protein
MATIVSKIIASENQVEFIKRQDKIRIKPKESIVLTLMKNYNKT